MNQEKENLDQVNEILESESIEMQDAKHLQIDELKTENGVLKRPDLDKPYPVRNFFKEIKRISWPTKAKNHRYLLWMFLFISFLIAFFALVSLGATEIIKIMGAN